MKKRSLLYLFIFVNLPCFSQDTKKIIEEFKKTKNDSLFFLKYSSNEYNVHTASGGWLLDRMDSIAFKLKKGQVRRLFGIDSLNYYVKTIEVDSALKMSAAQIWLCEKGCKYCYEKEQISHDSAMKLCDHILIELKNGRSFSELCALYSNDVGSKFKGGEYRSFFPGMMVKEFEEGVLAHKPGEVFLVDSMYGRHIVKTLEAPVMSRSEVKYIIFSVKPGR